MNDMLLCKMSRGLNVHADCSIKDAVAKEWDLIALPGGMPGAEHLRDSEPLIALLKKQKASGKLYAAICASPAVALMPHGLIDDADSATCYPAPKFQTVLKNLNTSDQVVVSGKLVTSQGPGTSLEFALQLGEELFGKERRDKIAKEMLVE
jgi:4-methyl-5(b-hydroxyethyl)-thiazole monophosphate biosynthesis